MIHHIELPALLTKEQLLEKYSDIFDQNDLNWESFEDVPERYLFYVKSLCDDLRNFHSVYPGFDKTKIYWVRNYNGDLRIYHSSQLPTIINMIGATEYLCKK